MKKILLALILFSEFLYSQSDSAKIRIYSGMVQSDVKGYGALNNKCTSDFEVSIKTLLNPKEYILEDYILCNFEGKPYFYYKVFNGEMSYIIPTKSMEFDDESTHDEVQLYFSTMTAELKNNYSGEIRNYVANLEKKKQLEQKIQDLDRDQDLLTSGFRALNNLLTISDFSFPGDYGYYGFEIEILNRSKQRIKYITFNLTGYNPVDDVVPTLVGKNVATRKGVGPVEPNDVATWTFENIWADNTFSVGKINSITVEYFNGTKKTYTNVGALVVPEGFKEAYERLEEWEKEALLEKK